MSTRIASAAFVVTLYYGNDDVEGIRHRDCHKMCWLLLVCRRRMVEESIDHRRNHCPSWSRLLWLVRRRSLWMVLTISSSTLFQSIVVVICFRSRIRIVIVICFVLLIVVGTTTIAVGGATIQCRRCSSRS